MYYHVIHYTNFVSPSCLNTLYLFSIVTGVTRLVSLVEQKLPTLAEHPGSTLPLGGFGLPGSLVYYAVLCRSLFVL